MDHHAIYQPAFDPCQSTGVAASGGGSSFPFSPVQELQTASGYSVSSYTITFPKTTASSGNTAFMLVAADGSQTVTLPSGWTVDFNITASTYARLILLQKTTASDTGATFSTSAATNYAVYFFELSGSHTLDQHSTGTSGNTNLTALPSITPSAGALVFGAECAVAASGPTVPYVAQFTTTMVSGWTPFGDVIAGNGARMLTGYVGQGAASAVSTTPPNINIPQWTLFTSGGVAYATFSII
jgi:hypothetical protein